MTVSLYAAIAVSVPLLLIQVWGFISPALYRHERAYVTPFVLLSSISFVGGVAFAYYVLFPPAVSYLLGLAEEFRPLLRATDYFDLITLIMLAMGLIFQMPAITYVLARIGLVSASSWQEAGNWRLSSSDRGCRRFTHRRYSQSLLFATPMAVLYVFPSSLRGYSAKNARPPNPFSTDHHRKVQPLSLFRHLEQLGITV